MAETETSTTAPAPETSEPQAESAPEAFGLVDGKLEATPASRVLSRDYPTVDPEKSVGDAYDLMREQNVSSLPLVDEAGRVLRVITKRDIDVMQSVFIDLPGMEERKARIMCIPLSLVNQGQTLVTAKDTDRLDAVARLLIDKTLCSVPVVNADGHYKGMLTVFTLLDLMAPKSGAEESKPEESKPGEAAPAT